MPTPSPTNPSQRIFYPRALVNLAFATNGRLGAADLLKLEAVEPLDLEVSCNDTSAADTFSITLDATLFPIDPAALADVVVDVFVGDVGSLGGQLVRDAQSRLILGNSEKLTMNFSNEKRPTVKITGADYTALMLKKTWGSNVIPFGRDVVSLVRDLLAANPATAALEVVSRFSGAPAIIPKGRGKKGEALAAKPDDKQWDVIQRIARAAALIAVVKADQVILQPPRNIAASDPAQIPLFVDGFNLSNLTIERSFKRDNLPNVLVWARNPRTGQRIEGRWPAVPNSTLHVVKSKGKVDKTREVTYREFHARWADPTPDSLAQIARGIWEQYAQQQLTVSFETKELYLHQQPYGGAVQDATFGYPATAITNGSPVRIHIDRRIRALLENTITEDARETVLRREGFKSRVAAALARSWSELDRVFFVDTATHTFSQGSGYALTVDAVNFIEVSV